MSRSTGADRWVRGLNAKYTSSRRVSLTADWYADDYWLVDAYVRFSGEALSELLRSTEFSIVANNLLDKAYLCLLFIHPRDGDHGYTQPERALGGRAVSGRTLQPLGPHRSMIGVDSTSLANIVERVSI